MTKRSDSVREQLRQFRQERSTFRAELEAVKKNPIYVQEYKTTQADKVRREHQDKLKVSARALYQATQKNLSIAKTQLAGVQHDQGKKWDYQRLAFMQAEIQAKLAGTGGASGGLLGGGVVQAIAAMREAFQTSGDFHGERALRTVALPLLAGIKPGTDPDSMAASNLRRQFKADEEAFIPAEVVELESEIRELGSLTSEVEIDIRQTEAAVTGRDDILAGASVFGRATSDWDFDVFGRERPAPPPERTKTEPDDKAQDTPPKQTDTEIMARLHSASAGARVFGVAAVVNQEAE